VPVRGPTPPGATQVHDTCSLARAASARTSGSVSDETTTAHPAYGD
jgi:hypothetical protein